MRARHTAGKARLAAESQAQDTRPVRERLSHSRLTDAHDELLYVIRKPENHFARLVLVWAGRKACRALLGRPR